MIQPTNTNFTRLFLTMKERKGKEQIKKKIKKIAGKKERERER